MKLIDMQCCGSGKRAQGAFHNLSSNAAKMKHLCGKVFFANFPFSMSDSEIAHYLEQVGSISHLEVFVNEQGSSRGCGIAEYVTSSQANEAVRRLNSTRIYGRAITVKPDDNSKGRVVAQKTYALAVLGDVFGESGVKQLNSPCKVVIEAVSDGQF
jgi:RNA recognition motif-containing protein